MIVDVFRNLGVFQIGQEAFRVLRKAILYHEVFLNQALIDHISHSDDGGHDLIVAISE